MKKSKSPGPISRLLFAVLALSLVAAACGDDDSEPQAPALSSPLELPADCISTFAPAQEDDDGMSMDDDGMSMEDDDDGMSMEDDDGMSMEDGMGEDGMMSMNMGDRCATPASQFGGELVSASFELLDVRPRDDYDNATGIAEMSANANGTTVTIAFAGLVPNTDFIAHVHADGCAVNGGDHYQFEVGGSVMPPNEIHLAFSSDAEGNGFMTAFNDSQVDDRAVAVVVHPSDLLDNKVACAEF